MKRIHTQQFELKDAVSEARLFRNRAMVAMLAVVLATLVLSWRAFKLQVVNYREFTTQSDRNRIRLVPEAPVRGLIYDRNGTLLAENRSVYSLELVPEKVKHLNTTLQGLSKLLAIPAEKISDFRKRLRSHRGGKFRQHPLLQRLTEKQRAIFDVNRYRFPGVSVQARLVRFYPYGKALVHLLGYVGRINDRELGRIDISNYRGTRNIGKVGLEKYYEQTLHGDVGFREVETNVHGRVLRVLKRTPPKPGDSLVLSVDLELQLAATKAMGKGRGALVAIDPQSGQVLALVSSPSYDPNAFVTGISSKNFKALIDSRDRPLFNRAVRGKYPPGSTIKPMLGLAGLEAGVITPQTTIFDPGWFQLEGDDHRYRDWLKWGHGKVRLFKAITQSCDTYFYSLAFHLGIDRLSTAMHHFGFGELTGIDIDEEVTALMPTREWKRRTRHEPWFPGETVITGIGQGFWTATPIQLANATAILANRGTRFETRLVQAVIHDGEVVQLEPQLADEQITVKPAYMNLVLRAMRAVNRRGTGARAFAGARFSSAGKTGTAQLVSIGQNEEYEAAKIAVNLRDNAMYLGFAPFKKPSIAIAVVMENRGHGGSSAAPVARKVMKLWLDIQRRSRPSAAHTKQKNTPEAKRG